MAVNTTVEVVMPPMGDSVSEGSILEWHKQEGDEVSEDETLVEISTDKVDAEVPAPVSGTVVKIHAAEGDTVGVGSVLAEIAPAERRRAGARRRCRRGRRRQPARRRRRRRRGDRHRDRDARDGRVGLRGHDPRVGEAPSATASPRTRRSSRSRPTRWTPRSPRPLRARSPSCSPTPATPCTVGQVIARMTCGNGAAPAKVAPKPEADRDASCELTRDTRDDRDARRPEGHAGRAARRRRAGHRPEQGHRAPARTAASARPTCSRFEENGAHRSGQDRRPGADGRQADPAQGRERDARALHGRVAADPDRDLVPHLHRHHARRLPQAAQGRRPEGLLHAPDRVRDRARGDGADAGDGDALRRDRRQAARDRRRRR